MKKKSKENSTVNTAFGVLLLILSIALCVGAKLVFHACGQTDEGKWMACHWAEQAAAALGGSMTVTAIILLCMKKSSAKFGIALAIIPQAIAAALIPNTLIRLCMMEDMRCHTVMKPAVIIISAAAAVLAVVCAVINARSGDRQ